MGGEMVVKRAKVGIHDDHRGVYLNRGVFIKAPPGFFHAYPKDFEAPPAGWQKLNVKVREIQKWDPVSGMLVPTAPEIPLPPPTVVAKDPLAPPAAVAEPVAAAPVAPVKRPVGRPRTKV